MRMQIPVTDEKTIERWRKRSHRSYSLAAHFLRSTSGKTSRFNGCLCWMLPGASLIIIYPDMTTIVVDASVYDESLKPDFLDFLEKISRIDYALLTHCHKDHYDPEVLGFLAERFRTKIAVPHILVDRVKRDKSIRNLLLPLEPKLETGFTSSISVLPFESPHGKSIPNFGYVLLDEGRRIFVTSDIRDYPAAAIPVSGKNADVMFFSMWLGSFKADRPEPRLVRDAADYIMRADPERVIFNHLYDTGRDRRDIWQAAHCRLVAEMTGWKSDRFYIPDYENAVTLWGDE